MEQIWSTYEDMKENIYVSDMDSYELLYMNRQLREVYGISSLEQIKGKKCYEFLQKNSAPCAMCTNCKIEQGDVYEWEFYNKHLNKVYQLRDQMILQNGRRMRVEVAMEQQSDRSDDSYHGIDQMALLINECMRMALQESEPDRGIRKLLEYLGQTLDGERVYIFELSDLRQWNNTYEWCAYNVEAEIDFLQNIPYNTIDVWLKEFHQNHFIAIRDIEAIKETDPDCYEYLEPQNIHSIIVGPLYKDGELSGFYGIDNPPTDKINEVTTMLKTIGHVIETMISKRALVEKLKELSYQDSMLKLGNRHAMQSYLSTLDRDKSIGILFCDVCGLKRVNDTLGHAAGDELLMQACNCLKAAFPKYELYRIGGDEMLVLASGVTEEDFLEHCNNLKLLMLEKDVPLALGRVWREKITENPENLISEADSRMYQDKALFYKTAGLTRWRSNEAWFGTTTRYEDIVECVHNGLEQALEEGQFIVYFQPQYNQRDRSLSGAEALVRWMHPEKGLISPDRFIPYLEQNGMISKLDEYVLRETCRHQRRWIDNGMKVVPVSVNLSRRDLQSEEICYRVKDTMEQFDLSPEYINLEVTESAYIENHDSVIEVVKKFQELGFKVEMDDFGSGYSSLNSLKDIPVNILKLDMKFVRGDTIGERSGKILSSIIRMAHWLDIPVIAEGVETKEQASFLCEIGCFYVQGYYFDRPIPEAEFEKRLKYAKPDLEKDARLTGKNAFPLEYFSSESVAAVLLDSSLGAAGIVEFDGNEYTLLRSNDAMYEMLGLTSFNNRMHDISEFFYEGYYEVFQKAIADVIASMDMTTCETLNINLDKPEMPFWVRVNLKYLHGYDGIYHFLIRVENIDKEKRAEMMNVKMYKILDQLNSLGAFGSMQVELNDVRRIGFFNSVTASMLGYTTEEMREIVKDDILALVADEDKEKMRQAVREAQKIGSGIVSQSILHICKDGSKKRFHVMGVTSDISSRHKFAKLLLLDDQMISETVHFTLHSSEKAEIRDYLMSVMDAIGVPMIHFSKREGLILQANRGFVKLLDFSTEDAAVVRYDRFEDYIWEDDREAVKESLAKLMDAAEKEIEFDLRIKTIDGLPKWVHARLHILQEAMAHQDIYISFEESELLNRMKLREIRQDHLDHAIGANPDVGIVFYRINGKRWHVDYISEGDLKIFGYTKEQMIELVQNDVLALVHPDDREQLRSYAVACAKERRNYEIRYRMLKANGEYVCVLTHASFEEFNHELYLCQTNINLSQMMKFEEREDFAILA